VVLLAGIAAVVSYRHMHTLTLAHGESSWTATLIPLSVDGMVVASSMTLLADSRAGRSAGVLPWVLLAIASVASLGANVAVAEPTACGRVIAAWPSLALIGGYELLMRQVRHLAAAEDAAPAGGLDSAATVRRSARGRSTAQGSVPTGRGEGRRLDAGLVAQARQIDAESWAQHGRPASAETLRACLHIGATSARQLKNLLRQAPPPPYTTPQVIPEGAGTVNTTV
jgi:hypothetical protein